MIREIEQEAKVKMQKSIKTLQDELTKLRTGRAHPSLIEHLKADYYGSEMPINQMANISILDNRTLLVNPWDKKAVHAVEKAILASDLGLNPVSMGDSLRVPLPPLTEERRKDLVKVVKHEAETARVSVRNVRRDAMQKLKDLLKTKHITEDEERRSQDQMQKLTDEFIANIEKIVKTKETELMEV